MSLPLPVYELEPPKRDAKRLTSLAAEVFGAESSQLAEPDGRTVARQDQVAVEQDHGSGGFFGADHERLRAPSERPTPTYPPNSAAQGGGQGRLRPTPAGG